MPCKNFSKPSSQAILDKILALLAERSRTRDELEAALGLSKPTVRSYLRHLQDEPRRIRISRWVRTNGNIAPAYGIGTKNDVRKPAPLDKKVRDAARIERLKADPDKWKSYMERRRISLVVRRVRSRPQTWMSTLSIDEVSVTPRATPNRRAD